MSDAKVPRQQSPNPPRRGAGLILVLGELRLNDMTLWMPHFEKYPKEYPIVVHSESRTMAAAILFAALYDRPVHVAHISLKRKFCSSRLPGNAALK